MTETWLGNTDTVRIKYTSDNRGTLDTAGNNQGQTIINPQKTKSSQDESFLHHFNCISLQTNITAGRGLSLSYWVNCILVLIWLKPDSYIVTANYITTKRTFILEEPPVPPRLSFFPAVRLHICDGSGGDKSSNTNCFALLFPRMNANY